MGLFRSNRLEFVELSDDVLAPGVTSNFKMCINYVVVQRFGQVKWKGNLSVLSFGGELGKTVGTAVVGPISGLCEGTGVLPYRVARNTQLSSDLA